MLLIAFIGLVNCHLQFRQVLDEQVDSFQSIGGTIFLVFANDDVRLPLEQIPLYVDTVTNVNGSVFHSILCMLCRSQVQTEFL